MTKLLVLDTSVYMQDIDVVEELSQEYDILFPAVVADELNNLKESPNNRKAFQARRAIRYIKENSDEWHYDSDTYAEDNDKIIINTASKHSALLATLDFGMELRAKVNDVELIDLNIRENSYSGYKEIDLYSENESEMELLSYWYSHLDENVFDCIPNEYVIIKQDDEVIDKARWDGDKYVPLQRTKTVIPKTVKQELAIDLVLDKDIPVKVLFGSAGSGKSFIATKLALEMLESSKYPYERILLIRNPIGAGEKIGFLKGTKEDKIESFFRPFEQHLDGDWQQFERLVNKGALKMEIPYYVKGLDLKNTLVLFDEAEDCNNKIMRLIGSRLSEGSAIIIMGDERQAEGCFRDNNGLTSLIQKAKGNKVFGCVEMPDDLRGDASKLFVDIF